MLTRDKLPEWGSLGCMHHLEEDAPVYSQHGRKCSTPILEGTCEEAKEGWATS